jgi:hypothetical protein
MKYMKIQMESQAIEFSYKKNHPNWHQAIFVDGVGRNSNRLPLDFGVKTITGGNESQRNYQR